MNISDSVLIESKSARDYGVSEVGSRGSELQILEKAKVAFFAVWRGTGYMTTDQVADYYGVSNDVIRQNYRRNEPEFLVDGVQRVDGEGLDSLRDIMSLSRARHVNLYTSRAVLRMGFILTGSEVAVAVRTAALNLIQGVGSHLTPEVLNGLLNSYPVLGPFTGPSGLGISSPLADYWDQIERHLKKQYPQGGILGYTKENIRDRIAALSTYTNSWQLSSKPEFGYNLGSSFRAKSPDLTSNVIAVQVDGQPKSAVLMFHINETIICDKDVEHVIGRQYLKRAKDDLGVDYAFLFLVAPFGATPYAEEYICRDLPSEMRGYVGVMTVKEVARLISDQARKERRINLHKGQIKQNFKDILNYSIPTDPLLLMASFSFSN